MKIKLLFLLMFNYSLIFSQVGIGTSNPIVQLEIASDRTDVASGILIPRLSFTALKFKGVLYDQRQEGTLLYITGPFDDTGTVDDTYKNITKEGFYYFDGNIWVNIANIDGSLSNTVTHNLYNNDGVLSDNRTLYGEDYTLSFLANTSQMSNQFKIDDLFSVDTQSKRIGVKTNTPDAKLNISNENISNSILNLDVLSSASIEAPPSNYTGSGQNSPNSGKKLYPLIIDNNGYVTTNGVIKDLLNRYGSYSVNQEYKLWEGTEKVIFTYLTEHAFLSFTFGTNSAFGPAEAGAVYGKVTFTKKDGFRVTNWSASGPVGQAATFSGSTRPSGSPNDWQMTFHYSKFSLIFRYYNINDTMTVMRSYTTPSVQEDATFTIWDGLKIRTTQ